MEKSIDQLTDEQSDLYSSVHMAKKLNVKVQTPGVILNQGRSKNIHTFHLNFTCLTPLDATPLTFQPK